MDTKEGSTEQASNGRPSVVNIKNPHLKTLPTDHLYHIALNTKEHDLYLLFHDVKFVCFGGQPSRMETFVGLINEELGLMINGHVPQNYAAGTDRYCVYKAGPVLSVSHGIGIPSLSVVFNEIVKLMYYAKCTDVQFFRIGTCGGLGLDPGTVVLTEKAVDGSFSSTYKLYILGKKNERPSLADPGLVDALQECANEDFEFKTVRGTTMCAEDFYECQARVDGAFCDYTEEEKMAYLKELAAKGVTNIEMESLGFLAMCRHAGIRGAVACVTLLDRLQEDNVTTDIKTLHEWQKRPQRLLLRYIKKQCKLRNAF